jgi:hypothetical protein
MFQQNFGFDATTVISENREKWVGMLSPAEFLINYSGVVIMTQAIRVGRGAPERCHAEFISEEQSSGDYMSFASGPMDTMASILRRFPVAFRTTASKRLRHLDLLWSRSRNLEFQSTTVSGVALDCSTPLLVVLLVLLGLVSNVQLKVSRPVNSQELSTFANGIDKLHIADLRKQLSMYCTHVMPLAH